MNRFARPVVLCVIAVAGPLGCVDRLNHLYHEPNQRAAQQALDEIEGFASESAGLRPQLLKNIEARSALARTVAARRSELDDADRIIALGDVTWLSLRQRAFRDLNVTTLNGTILSDDQIRNSKPSLDPLIDRRIAQLHALSKTLEALAEGQAALIKQATRDVKQFADAAKPPADGAAPADDAAADDPTDRERALTFVNLLIDLRLAVTASGRQSLTQASQEAEAEALRQSIISGAEASRDPSTVYAVVAMVGTGLREGTGRRPGSPAQLDLFINELKKRVDAMKVDEAEALKGTATANVWGKFHTSLREARVLLSGAVLARSVDPLRNRVYPVQQANLLAESDKVKAEIAAFDTLAEAIGKLPGAAAVAYDPPTSQEYDDAADEAKLAALIRREVAEMGDAVDAVFGKSEAADIAVRFASLSNRMTREIGRLRDQVEAFPATAAAVENLLASAAAGKNPSPEALEASGLEVMRRVLKANPSLLSELERQSKNGVLRDADLKHLGSVVQDIRDQKGASARRMAMFLHDLYSAQLALHQENARHYTALLAIAAAELGRWGLIDELNSEFDSAFGSGLVERPGGAGVANPENPLFAEAAQVEKWWGEHPWQGNLNDAPKDPLLRHPVIGFDEDVTHTIRRLAETAAQWQGLSPNQNDPEGWHRRRSYERLNRAVRTLNVFTLMASMNQRLGEEHAVRLRGEVDEHNLHLDAVVARAEEASLRYGARDLLAFHSTGITEADLQVVIGAVHSALLAWIGSGV